MATRLTSVFFMALGIRSPGNAEQLTIQPAVS